MAEYPQLETSSLWRLLEVTRQLGQPVELESALRNVVDVAREVLVADRGSVFLYDESRNELYSKVATSEEEIRFPADKGIAGECASCRQVINVPDCYCDERFNPEVDRSTGYRTRCLLSVPLVGIDEELVGVLQVLNKLDGVFSELDEQVAAALGAQCAVTVQRAQLIEQYREKERMERDLAIARDIQQGVFPTEMPDLSGYQVAGWSRPAEETGGDIYDVIPLGDERILLLMGDATGHGIGPALSVTQVRAMCRMAARMDTPLDALVTHINDQLEDDLTSGRFVTAFLGILDGTTHRVTYHAAGQAPLLHLHAQDGRVEKINSTMMPLGIMSGLAVGDAAQATLEPGDALLVLSDGSFEASDGKELFGVQRVCDLLKEHHHLDASEMIRQLDEAVRGFMKGAPQADDMTMVVVKRLQD